MQLVADLQLLKVWKVSGNDADGLEITGANPLHYLQNAQRWKGFEGQKFIVHWVLGQEREVLDTRKNNRHMPEARSLLQTTKIIS